MARPFRIITAAVALAALSACTVHKQAEAPALTGPSETGTSVSLSVTPDIITQDGASQALVTAIVYGPSGQPLRSVSLRAEIIVGGASADFGTLSARNVVTDASGRATLTYTAPPAPVFNVDTGTTVDIAVTPIGTDFANSMSRFATIRLVPPGVVGPGASPLRPEFTVPTATVGNSAVFQATVVDSAGADATSQVVSYAWSFGDGGSASGRTVTHTYTSPGSFPVTLTITDTLGRTQRVSHTVTTGQGQLPTASFVVSPTSPGVHQTVNFNGAGSTAEAGHSIVSYEWNFGDGTTGGGQTASHAYDTAGSYTATLQVTDDAGRRSAIASQSINVGTNLPTASFTTSPASPIVDQAITFNASQSKPAAGRTITSYAWDFGDGARGSGVTTTHSYSITGTYTVMLTVTDNAGQTAFATQTITVTNGNPTADFTFNPSAPRSGQQVTFDASPSQAAGGRTIVSYSWSFGDGGAGSGQNVTHIFTLPGVTPATFNVLLTVTDSSGKTSSITKPITINP